MCRTVIILLARNESLNEKHTKAAHQPEAQNFHLEMLLGPTPVVVTCLPGPPSAFQGATITRTPCTSMLLITKCGTSWSSMFCLFYSTCIELNLAEQMVAGHAFTLLFDSSLLQTADGLLLELEAYSFGTLLLVALSPDSSRGHFSVVRQVHSPPPRSYLRPLLLTVPLPLLSTILSSSFALNEMAQR